MSKIELSKIELCGSCIAGLVPGDTGIERCDECQLYADDNAAADAVLTIVQWAQHYAPDEGDVVTGLAEMLRMSRCQITTQHSTVTHHRCDDCGEPASSDFETAADFSEVNDGRDTSETYAGRQVILVEDDGVNLYYGLAGEDCWRWIVRGGSARTHDESCDLDEDCTCGAGSNHTGSDQDCTVDCDCDCDGPPC